MGVKLLPEGRTMPEKVKRELELKNSLKYTGNELIFEPSTGLLIIKRQEDNKPSADCTVLDQIAEDGFLYN